MISQKKKKKKVLFLVFSLACVENAHSEFIRLQPNNRIGRKRENDVAKAPANETRVEIPHIFPIFF